MEFSLAVCNLFERNNKIRKKNVVNCRINNFDFGNIWERNSMDNLSRYCVH